MFIHKAVLFDNEAFQRDKGLLTASVTCVPNNGGLTMSCYTLAPGIQGTWRCSVTVGVSILSQSRKDLQQIFQRHNKEISSKM